MVKTTGILVAVLAVTISISFFLLPATTIADTTTPDNAANGFSRATIMYVSPTGENTNPGTAALPFQTIQHGIDVAAAEGDTLLLADGIYTGDGNRDIDYLGKSIVVQSESDNPEACIIDCQGSEIDHHRGFIFQNYETRAAKLGGVTVKNGFSTTGGAIHIGVYVSDTPAAKPSISNCIFINNHADDAGAIYVDWYSGPSIVDCSFIGNSADRGGALHICYMARCQISNCQFMENTASLKGGVIHALWENLNNYENCSFINNSAPNGGVYYNYQMGSKYKNVLKNLENRGWETFTQCEFRDNEAEIGGVIYGRFWGYPEFLECDFIGNSATIEGGVMYDLFARYGFYNCNFANNSAPTGGVISAVGHEFTHDTGGRILSSTFYNNQASDGSSLAYKDMGLRSYEIENCIFVGGVGSPAISYSNVDNLELACVNIYNNEGGDWVGDLADLLVNDGHISADPLFCDAPAGDFSITSNSPCLPENHPDGTSCGLIGAGDIGCSVNPVITGIVDVGNDQGGQVRLVWDQCTYDSPGSMLPITGYGVYRRQDGYKQQPDTATRLSGWDFLEIVPARGDDVYQYVARTLCDSTVNHGMCLTSFMVSAMTDSPTVFFDSLPDSGYSVDNLSPEEPSNLNVAVSNEVNILSWEASASEDVSNYMVFRDPPFADSSSVITSGGTNWEDRFDNSNINGADYNYSLAAVDHSGNLSDVIYPTGISSASDNHLPVAFALYGNTPNPFNPSTTISYDLPLSSPVRLRIYDIAGRLVRELSPEAAVSAGNHEIMWNGTDDTGRRVSSGVYLYRIEASGFVKTRQMVLVK